MCFDEFDLKGFGVLAIDPFSMSPQNPAPSYVQNSA